MVKQHPLSPAQLSKILDAAKQESVRDFCILTLFSNHAIRCSELRQMKTSDVNVKDRVLFVRRLKNSISGHETILEWEIPAIESWLAEKPVSDLLFPSPRGGALSRTQVYNIVRYYAEKTGAPAVSRSPHCFRHSLGDHLARGGVEIKKLQRILGHRNINSTAQYYEFSQRECDEAKRLVFASRLVAGSAA